MNGRKLCCPLELLISAPIALSIFLPASLLAQPVEVTETSTIVSPETNGPAELEATEELEIEAEGAASEEPLVQSAALPSEASQPKGELSLGGALRFNYLAKTWDKLNQKRGGDFRFDTLRLNTGLRYGKLIAASEYRFYGAFGSYLKYGWIGVQFNEQESLKVGVHKVPFGLLPYASHNWFFNLGYYVGLEDDHDLGLLYEYNGGGWEFDLAYYHSDEGHFVGKSLDSARYSYDLVRVP